MPGCARSSSSAACTWSSISATSLARGGGQPNVNRVLPINFCGGPDEIVAQLKQCREQIGAGVVDLSFQTPGSEDPDELMEALELFGKKCCRTSATSENKRRRQMAAGFHEEPRQAEEPLRRQLHRSRAQR